LHGSSALSHHAQPNASRTIAISFRRNDAATSSAPHVPSARRVVVVGAGPGGLQGAITAASRGHQVTVLERLAVAGGQARVAATVPSRAEFGDIVRNQVRECRRLGVEVRFGIDADAPTVAALAPDVVVVATGARPQRPWWAPGDAATVVDVRDVLEGRAAPAGAVVVVDEVGFHQATSVAEWLADRGCAVTVITPGMVVGQDLGITLDLEHWNTRAAAKGIVQLTDLVPMGSSAGDGLTALHHPTGDERRLACDWVVLAVPQQPNEELYFELLARVPDVHRVGDCVAPRRAHAAVIEGDRVGAAL
jgi:2,4-dienoyl-CoA reductase (NADPH2)